MRKYITLSICLAAFAIPSTPFASQTLVNDVRTFYDKFETSIDQGDVQTTLDLIDTHVAEDFGHYDNGEFIYGKKQFKNIVSSNSERKVGNEVNIDMKDVKYSEETNEILANFTIKQDFYSEITNEGQTDRKLEESMTLECNDYLRILDDNTFKLYKCDCTILEKINN